MDDHLLSRKVSRIALSVNTIMSVINNPDFEKRNQDLEACDFLLGNPHEMPLNGFVAALKKSVVPHDKDWFAYKMNEPDARQTVADSLQSWRELPYRAEDIFLTTGAFSALSVALNAVLDPEDEVIFISPPWFFYEAMILAANAIPVRVKMAANFDQDLATIDATITPRTRAIIINSPNNPTGKIYPSQTLRSLGLLLEAAQKITGRPIFLLSDESYSKIIFDNRRFVSPTVFHPYSFLIYTYGKTLLTPGQRLGFIALPPELLDPQPLRDSLFLSQMVSGYAFPNALLQHALPDLDKLSIDIHHLQEKRDQMVRALQEIGYQVHHPEGTFYLLPKSPWVDDMAFVRLLMEHKIYCLPGSVAEMPGYFRISLTANDAMIDRSLSGFAMALERARKHQPLRAREAVHS
jgi:aspartate aminotransferase